MADDPFEAARNKLAEAMQALRAVQVAAGSRDSRVAGYAMESMGSAYSYLSPSTDNPAWSE